MGVDGRVQPDHSLLSVISAKLLLLPAEKAVQEARSGPAQQARTGPSQAPAQRAFGAPPVVLVRQAVVAAPAQHGTARPYLHGTSFHRCRHHDLSANADPAMRPNGQHMEPLTMIRSGTRVAGRPCTLAGTCPQAARSPDGAYPQPAGHRPHA